MVGRETVEREASNEESPRDAMASSSIASPRSLYREATRAALVGLLINFTLGVVKLIGGVLGNSFALISDAVNSLGDTLTSTVSLGGLWYAQQPADAEHPYGHTRAETVAGGYLAVVIVGSALLVGWEAVNHFFDQHTLPQAWTIWIAAFNIVIKEMLYRYNRRVGERTGSLAIVATAWDHRSDALGSLAVLVGLIAVRFAGPNFIWADEAAALVIVLIILFSGGGVLWQSTHELLDPQADPDIVDEVRQLAENVPKVRAIEKLRVRKTGIEYLVDVHVQVDATMTVEESHQIGHAVKDRIVAEMATVRDVLVHIEPFDETNNKTHCAC